MKDVLLGPVHTVCELCEYTVNILKASAKHYRFVSVLQKWKLHPHNCSEVGPHMQQYSKARVSKSGSESHRAAVQGCQVIDPCSRSLAVLVRGRPASAECQQRVFLESPDVAGWVKAWAEQLLTSPSTEGCLSAMLD